MTGIEPVSSRPQREVLTTILHGPKEGHLGGGDNKKGQVKVAKKED